MSQLPSSQTPLNQHSLSSLELWLADLGAQRSESDLSSWTLCRPLWSAEIKMEIDELRVSWEKDGKRCECCFPYGLPRQDVEVAISQGP